ncbi:hypothetical protein K7432_004797 [Basidiobolus ranarum]|uniref:Arrestin C-terminal-like domain-containing protein n=1 Tax=Basidiobolus ranarum TaxID=34480 RepID=A0ABR2WXQ9_9FUNG
MTVSSSSFDIFLLKDVLYKNDDLMNPSQLSVRGTILFHPTNTVRVRKITVELLGMLSIQLPAAVKKSKRVLISQSITLLNNAKPVAIPSKSIYHFEFLLPGDLPDSFDCEFAKVEYSVKAVAETSLFTSDLKAQRPIFIRRHVNYADSEDICETHKVYENQLECNVTIPTTEFTPGEKFELNIKGKPLAIDGRVTSVTCFVKEVVRYQIPSKSNPNEITVGEYLRRLEFTGTNFSQEDTEVDCSLVIKIPEANVSYECLNSLVEISHTLSFRFHTSTEVSRDQLVLDIPIMIVPTTGPFMYDQLPLYQAVELPPTYQAVSTPVPAGQEAYPSPPNYVC